MLPLPHESRDAEVLFEGPGLLVVGKDESAYAEMDGEAGPVVVVVGDFYGGPLGAAVDDERQWCVSVGRSGAVVYRLQPPWMDYEYWQPPNDQWWEVGQRPDSNLHFIAVHYEGEMRFRIHPGEDSASPHPVILDARAGTWTGG